MNDQEKIINLVNEIAKTTSKEPDIQKRIAALKVSVTLEEQILTHELTQKLIHDHYSGQTQ